MVTVILLLIPLTIPRLFGIRIYGVLTGSMTPSYSVGGVVYVKKAVPCDIQLGDVIVFRMGTETENVMTHRVVEKDGSFFVTKGDANDCVDPEPVSYDRLIGKVIGFLPYLACVEEFVNSSTGRSVLIMLFAAAFLLWVAADFLASSKVAFTKAIPGKGQLMGLVLILGASVYLGGVFWENRSGVAEYRALEEAVFAEDFRGNDKTPETEDVTSQTAALTEEEERILDEIGKLREENPEVIGWIQFDHLAISYPIMQGTDNEYYLKHTFSGEYNRAGSIFMEASNAPDFNDSHTILYGHNMKNQSMFGTLKNYKTENFYPDNAYFTIYTPDQVYRYAIFAYYDTSTDSEIYNVQFEPGGVFQKILDNMCRHSYYDTKICPESTEKILTLSTCSAKDKRFVVHATRILEKSRNS